MTKVRNGKSGGFLTARVRSAVLFSSFFRCFSLPSSIFFLSCADAAPRPRVHTYSACVCIYVLCRVESVAHTPKKHVN